MKKERVWCRGERDIYRYCARSPYPWFRQSRMSDSPEIWGDLRTKGMGIAALRSTYNEAIHKSLYNHLRCNGARRQDSRLRG